jgi:hypothetical protein
MPFIAFILKWAMRLIYVLLTGIILYFPLAGLYIYATRELRFARIPEPFPIDDTLLPLFILALLYCVIATLRRKADSAVSGNPAATSSGND